MTRKRGRALCVPRAQGVAARDPRALYVDSADCAPPSAERFRPLNPFHLFARACIVVPGRPRFRARSVESVWQGLKLVRGRTCLSMLMKTPTKRPKESARRGAFRYEDARFDFHGASVGLVEARYLIYVPTYEHLLQNVVPDAVHGEIRAALAEGRDVVFFDWDENFDIEDPRASFSHSAMLAFWYGGTYERDVRVRARRFLRHREKP